MIQQLYIRDFAVIDEVDLEFGEGLNLLTGETGSGKSIIVDAIGVALGERADSDSVRSGFERALVELVIEVGDSSDVLRLLEEAGIEPEDGRLIISREIQRSGKSQCRINGRASTVSLLKGITDHLVDTHGQHEHQYLLRAERHIDVLDSWCGQEVSVLKDRVAESCASFRSLESELQQLRRDERDRARTIDLFRFQLKEITEANLTVGEEEELQADRIRLANAEKLHAAASTAFELLGDRMQEKCALDSLSEGVDALQDIARLDSQVAAMLESLQAALYQVEDATRELREYRDGIEFNPERLESVNERLDLIRNLKRKYGESTEEIIEYGADLEKRLESLVNSDERSAELESEIEKARAVAMLAAEELSELRRAGGESFSSAVQKELTSLSMPDAIFNIQCDRKDIDSSGIDKLEFIFSANPGEPTRPLAKIASGGEISRVMLAIKSAMAAVDTMPTLVFDEVDVGVGGRTAEVIASKLESLAGKSQVLCITHLPQIASRNGRHFSIEKQIVDRRTVVRVHRLSDTDRVSELARMLGGSNPSGTALQHAREMLGYS